MGAQQVLREQKCDRMKFLAALNAVIGIAKDTGDSVKEVREIRKQIYREDMSIEELNKA